MPRKPRLAPPVFLVSALLVGCPPGTDPTAGGFGSDPAPEFSLTDVNAGSPRFEQAVSPRDYLGEVSAWYFGHAT